MVGNMTESEFECLKDQALTLIADNALLHDVHDWLCHPDGEPCPDGCDTPASHDHAKAWDMVHDEVRAAWEKIYG